MCFLRIGSSQKVNAKIHACFYIALCAVIVVLSIVCINTSRNTGDMDSTARELTAENDRLTTENGRLAKEIKDTAERLREANDELASITSGFSTVEQGLSEISSGISGVLDSMRSYLPETQDPH